MEGDNDEWFKIRWMRSSDQERVLEIRNQSMEPNMSRKRLHEILMGKKFPDGTASDVPIAMVAIDSEELIIGYVIFTLRKGYTELMGLTVDQCHLRYGVGTALLKKLIARLHPNRRTWIEMVISETRLEGQLFLRENNFLAVQVVKGRDGVDGYLMRYTLGTSAELCAALTNRISKYWTTRG